MVYLLSIVTLFSLVFSYFIFIRYKEECLKLQQLIDRAFKEDFTESVFDETLYSALETKLYQYLQAKDIQQMKYKQDQITVQQLISDIAHQTKTPIANLRLYAELLSEETLNTDQMQSVQLILKQSEKLSFLIEALVKSSRLETDMLVLSPKAEKIDELLEAVISQNQNTAKQKAIKVQYTPRGYEANFDKKWSIEAIHNILDNAIKYSHFGGHVHIETIVYPMFLRVDIRDFGIGIKEDDYPKIFTRFYRAENVLSKEGIGLGLYLSREIIQRQNGYIKVTSDKEKGTTFSVFLPVPF